MLIKNFFEKSFLRKNTFFLKRKGQLSLFLVIALLIIVIIGLLFLTINKKEIKNSPDIESLKQSISSCLHKTLKDGLITIGQTGGFYGDSLNNIPFSNIPTDSEGLIFEGRKIPYWYFVDNNCGEFGCLKTNIPFLCKENPCPINSIGEPSIEGSLESYVDNNLEACINNLKSNFDYNIKVLKKPSSKVLITKNDVKVKVKMPILITHLNENINIDSFESKVDLSLLDYYNTALDIVNLEKKSNFLENIFLHLLSVYQGVDKEIPPFYDLKVGLGEKFWVTQKIKQLIETDLMPYFNFIQISNSLFFNPIVTNQSVEFDDFLTGFYSYLNIKLSDSIIPYKISFFYPYKSIYLNINNKEFLKPTTIKTFGLIKPFINGLFHLYRFYYDVAFPLTITIDDPFAFNDEGYSFSFAVEGNIINNKPFNNSNLPIISLSNLQFLSNPDDPQNKLDNIITIKAVDNLTGSPIVNARVAYECGYVFEEGVTDNNGLWRGKLPYCPVGGFLFIEKPFKYKKTGIRLNNDYNINKNYFVLKAWPIIKKKIILLKSNNSYPSLRNAMVLDYNKIINYNVSALINDSEENISLSTELNEFGMVRLFKEKDNGFDDNFPLLNTFLFGNDDYSIKPKTKEELNYLTKLFNEGNISKEVYDASLKSLQNSINNEVKLSLFRDVLLVPGDYYFEATLFFDGLIQLPPGKKSFGHFPFKKTVHLPPINLSSWILGSNKGLLRISPDELYDDNILVFIIKEYPVPKDWDSLLDDAERNKLFYVRPIFVKHETLFSLLRLDNY